eukprot:6181039-Pleurochrysis_carterae.AAC.3
MLSQPKTWRCSETRGRAAEARAHRAPLRSSRWASTLPRAHARGTDRGIWTSKGAGRGGEQKENEERGERHA